MGEGAPRELQDDDQSVNPTYAGDPITSLEEGLPSFQTEATDLLRQRVGELQGQGYTFAEGRSFHTATAATEYAADQESRGRTVLDYYSGGQMDLFSFNPPEQTPEQ